MDFYEVLDKVTELLQHHGRATYRALKLQFNLDDEALEALKDELLFGHPVADREGQGHCRPRNGHPTILQRLPHHLQYTAAKLGQLIEEQYGVPCGTNDTPHWCWELTPKSGTSLY